MGVTKETLPDRIIEQLDAAVLPAGRKSAQWCGYWVTVTVKD